MAWILLCLGVLRSDAGHSILCFHDKEKHQRLRGLRVPSRLSVPSERLMMRVTVICDRRHGIVPENNVAFPSMSCARA